MIVIGKCDKDCERVEFHGWPTHVSASRFDYGYGCVYQVSIKHGSAATVDR